MQKLKKILNALFLDASGFAIVGAVICSLSEAVPFSFFNLQNFNHFPKN